MTKKTLSMYLALGVSALAFAPVSGLAVATAQEADVEADKRLDTVVVNATKRQANEEDLPIAIETFSGAEIEGSGVVTIDDLALVSASTNIPLTAGSVQPYIRGIGSGSSGPGTYASVATYIDGVYQSDNIGLQNATLQNAESVQVLKGPQGTLYGRNATGGAILITTSSPEPGEAFNGFGQIELGDFNTRRINGGASVGLSDTFAFGVNFAVNKRDGFIENLAPGGDMDDEDGYNVSGKLVFEPTDRLSFVGAASYREDERVSLAWQQVGQFDNFGALPGLNNPQTLYAGTVLQFIEGGVLAGGGTQADADAAVAAAIPTLLGLAAQIQFPGFGVTADNAAQNGFQAGINPGGGEFRDAPVDYFDRTTLSLNSTLSLDSFDIVSITSYVEGVNNANGDILRADPSTLPDLTVLGLPALFNQGNIGFTTGVEFETFTQEVYAVSTDGPVEWIVGAYYFNDQGDINVTGDALGTSALVTNNFFEIESISVYSEATVPLTEAISFTGGLRYTDEESAIDDELVGSPIPNVGSISTSNDQLTYNAKLTYDTGDFLAYTGVSTGFKSGSLNSANPGAGVVAPEEVTAYEAGFKTALNDGGVRLTGAIFHYDFENIQLNVLETNAGVIFLVDGVEADITGAELGIEAQLSDSFDVFANATYLDTEYNTDATIVATGVTQPIAGNDLALSPEFAAAFGVNYSQDITSDIVMTGRFIGNYNSGYWTDQSNTFGSGGDDDEGFFVANASVDFTKGNWTLSGYINNMFDEEYFVSGFAGAGGLSQVADPTRPRHFGARLRVDF